MLRSCLCLLCLLQTQLQYSIAGRFDRRSLSSAYVIQNLPTVESLLIKGVCFQFNTSHFSITLSLVSTHPRPQSLSQPCYEFNTTTNLCSICVFTHAYLVECNFAVARVLVDNLHGAVVVYTPFATHYVVNTRCHFVPLVMVAIPTHITTVTGDSNSPVTSYITRWNLTLGV